MTFDLLSNADAWRWVTAAASLAVLFLLVIGVVLHGDALPGVWRRVLWAIVVEQGVLAYLAVSRARDDGPRFPEVVDVPLVALTLSALALLATIVVVVTQERRDPRI